MESIHMVVPVHSYLNPAIIMDVGGHIGAIQDPFCKIRISSSSRSIGQLVDTVLLEKAKMSKVDSEQEPLTGTRTLTQVNC
jgi:hypothetical protein